VSSGAESGPLRAEVREALRELLPGLLGDESREGRREAARPHGELATDPAPWRDGGLAREAGFGQLSPDKLETVSIRNDAELSAFVIRMLHLFENPKSREELRCGRLRFKLLSASLPGSVKPVHRIDKGAVTEAMVREAARSGARIVLGPDAVLTPLGHDRARADGVLVSKEER
jgi:hypothetical protein